MDRIKNFFKNNEKDIILIAGVILISLISFGAGRLSVPAIPKTPITVEEMPLEASIIPSSQDNISNINSNQNQNQESRNQEPNAPGQKECLLVGSKNSNKYHYPWCIGAKNISEKNKICFNSKEEAQGKGYQPAGNCPGLTIENVSR